MSADFASPAAAYAIGFGVGLLWAAVRWRSTIAAAVRARLARLAKLAKR